MTGLDRFRPVLSECGESMPMSSPLSTAWAKRKRVNKIEHKGIDDDELKEDRVRDVKPFTSRTLTLVPIGLS